MLACEAPVYRPASLGEALRMRAEMPDATVLAGGTDIFVYLEAGVLRPARVIDVWNLPGQRSIRATGGGVYYGAGATCTDVVRHAASHGLLREACLTVGAVQIQNRATLGGNICNGSPAGDTLPVWLALDALFHVASVRGERAIPAAEFWLGYKKTRMEPDELMIGISAADTVGRAHFRKVGTRMAQSISKVVFAGRHAEGEARLAFGAVGPVPLRVPTAEAALASGASVAEVCRLVREGIRPIDDVRSTAEYRARVAQNVVRRWLEGG